MKQLLFKAECVDGLLRGVVHTVILDTPAPEPGMTPAFAWNVAGPDGIERFEYNWQERTYDNGGAKIDVKVWSCGVPVVQFYTEDMAHWPKP